MFMSFSLFPRTLLPCNMLEMWRVIFMLSKKLPCKTGGVEGLKTAWMKELVLVSSGWECVWNTVLQLSELLCSDWSNVDMTKRKHFWGGNQRFVRESWDYFCFASPFSFDSMANMYYQMFAKKRSYIQWEVGFFVSAVWKFQKNVFLKYLSTLFLLYEYYL